MKARDALVCVYTFHPNNLAWVFLSLLLYTVRDPTSFAALKSVNDQVFATFHEACQMRGLLEAAAAQLSTRLKNLFTIFLTPCGSLTKKA